MHAPRFYFRPRGIAATLLAPLGAIYGTVAAARMRRVGLRASVPVICIGNLTLGGAGKTPTAIAIAALLAELGERPVFVSRGYSGREAGPLLVDPAEHDAATVGDEPLLLAREFATIVARDRVAGANLAEQHNASVIVLDDGFQNPSLAKDVSILVIDATVGVGNGAVFPAGPLRAPLRTQLELAHAVVLVGMGANAMAALAHGVELPVFAARLAPEAATSMILAGQKALAFAGIGHPEKFFATLAEIGVEPTERIAFPDHHRYSAEDARRLIETAAMRGLALLTTEKDLIRMKGDPALAQLSEAARALPVRLEFTDAVQVRRMLQAALAKARQRI
jgi:tetraacyldisaccharide 4'-kinase